MEAQVSYQSLLFTLDILAGDLRRMLKSRTVTPYNPAVIIERLTGKEISYLKATLKKVTDITAQINSGILTEDAPILAICECPVHLRELDTAGIFSLLDLIACREEDFRKALRRADAQVGQKHYALWFIAKYKENRRMNIYPI